MYLILSKDIDLKTVVKIVEFSEHTGCNIGLVLLLTEDILRSGTSGTVGVLNDGSLILFHISDRPVQAHLKSHLKYFIDAFYQSSSNIHFLKIKQGDSVMQKDDEPV